MALASQIMQQQVKASSTTSQRSKLLRIGRISVWRTAVTATAHRLNRTMQFCQTTLVIAFGVNSSKRLPTGFDSTIYQAKQLLCTACYCLATDLPDKIAQLQFLPNQLGWTIVALIRRLEERIRVSYDHSLLVFVRNASTSSEQIWCLIAGWHHC